MRGYGNGERVYRHGRYYVKITATDGTHTVEDVVSDTTFDRMLAMHTTCTVAAARNLDGTSDLSHEHLAEGTTDQIDTVYDHEGNRYAVVQIGDQCWLKENMRCTTSPRQGTGVGQINLTLATATNQWQVNNPYYFATTNVPLYGYFYSYTAALDLNAVPAAAPTTPHRGICPEGWHIPVSAEWHTLQDAVSTIPVTDGDWTGDHSGKLSSCSWPDDNPPIIVPIEAGSPLDRTCDLNATGFSALPAGKFTEFTITQPNYSAFFVALEPNYPIHSWQVTWSWYTKGVYNGNLNAWDGMSVRCVKDN